MNKQKLIDYLRSPESLTEGQLEDLNKSLVDFPYFSIGISIAARASKDLVHASEDTLTASAAIYATDRKHLKKYINGELVFLVDSPQVQEEAPQETKIEESAPSLVSTKNSSEAAHSMEKDTPPSDSRDREQTAPATTSTTLLTDSDLNPENLKAPTGDEIDQLLDELEHDMDDLKKSRGHFVDIQNQIEEEEAFSSALRKVAEKVQGLETKEDHPAKEESKQEEVESEEIKEQPKPETSKSVEPTKESVKESDSAIQAKTAKEEKKKKKNTEPKVKADSKLAQPTTITNFEIENPDEEDEKEDSQSIAEAMESIKKEKEADDLDEETATKKARQPARSSRGNRQKIKRSDLDKVMGTPTKKEKPKKDKKAPLKVVVKSSEKAEEKEEKPKKKTTIKLVDKSPEVSKSIDEDIQFIVGKEASEETPGESKAEKLTKNQLSKNKKQKTTTKTETETKKEDDRSVRSSARAFLDYGRGGISTSISKASPSRKRKSSGSKSSTRATKPASKSTGSTKKGGKDDDEAGGTNQLIEKFIKDSPSIKRRSGTDITSDLSEESSAWNPELVSEYLAQIYLDQGNSKRAISIYETLSLKFPEKKSYFASLIQEIKKPT